MEEEGFSSLRIPDEIIFDILKRLPAKSLMRFKCVCKAWLSLICDPHFAKSHHVHAQTRSDASYLLLRVQDPKVIFPTNLEGKFLSQLPTWVMKESYNIHCTHVVNGLMCHFNHFKDQLFMVNLTTREEIALPDPGIQDILCEHTSNVPPYILGFDPITFKYKLLHLGNDLVQFEILTLGTNSWRKLDWPNFELFQTHFCSNGVIYFLLMGSREVQFFDVNEEKFQMLDDLQVVEGIHQQTRIERNFPLERDGLSCKIFWILNYEDKVWVTDEIQLPEQASFHQTETLGNKAGEILIVRSGFNSWWLILGDLRTKEFRTTEITPHPQMQLSTTNNPQDTYISRVYYHIENILPLKQYCQEPAGKRRNEKGKPELGIAGRISRRSFWSKIKGKIRRLRCISSND